MKNKAFRLSYRELQLGEEEKNQVLDLILHRAKDTNKKQLRRNRLWLAAGIAAALMLLGCAASALRLQDLKIGEYPGESSGTMVTEEVRNVISLQGVQGSRNWMAAKEWFEFKSGYEIPWDTLEADGYEAPPDYTAYSVLTREMQDHLDGICEKYDLLLSGSGAAVQRYHDFSVFLDAVGLEGLCRDGAEAEYGTCYFFESGNFDAEFQLYPEPGREVVIQMRYSGKKYLDTAYWVPLGSYEEWNLKTQEGLTVLAVMDQEYVRLLCDQEDAFLTVTFPAAYQTELGEVRKLTREDVQQIADSLDFTVKSHKVDILAVTKQIQEAEQAYQSQKGEPAHHGYAEYVQWLIPWREETFEDPPPLYFNLIDLNGDGTAELLIGYETEMSIMYTLEENGEIQFFNVEEEKWDKIAEQWLTMEKTPIEEFPLT